ncbi:MAG: hypothetical protein QI223_04640 [Candidatus Korarchaeota archaeon]|nr:hypothetical protein [Candidatus Korarchaeota archaeon]
MGKLTSLTPTFFVEALLVIGAALVAPPSSAQPSSEVGVAVSGSFYLYNYTLSVGQVLSRPDTYIVTFNHGSRSVNISLRVWSEPENPLLRVELSAWNFTLDPGESRKVLITIVAEPGAPPGIYDVHVEAYASVRMPETGGSMAVPAASLHSFVKIVGEQSVVEVSVVSPSGVPVPTEIRLVYITDRGSFTIARSMNGTLKARVAPGHYRVAAYLAGELLNETALTVEPGSVHRIHLRVSTVHFSSFSVMPALDKGGEIGYAYVVGVVDNLHSELENVTVILRVWSPSGEVDEVALARTPVLTAGKSEFKANYIPPGGWEEGTYIFQMLLYSDGTLYAYTHNASFRVTPGMVPKAAGVPSTLVYLAPVVVAAVAAAALGLRRAAGLTGDAWYDLDSGTLFVRLKNGLKGAVRVRKIAVLTLDGREILASSEPRSREYKSPRVPARGSATFGLRDKDGGVIDAMAEGGVKISIQTDRGEVKLSLRAG